MKLQREFYQRSGLIVARELIGKKLVHGDTAGIIVDVEAYMGAIDAAAHSYRGRTKRTAIQFGEGGYAYVYLVYGTRICFNVVANVKDVPEAILIRALQPTDGIELMINRRNKNNLRELSNGPSKLTQAMGIGINHYGVDLCGDELYIESVDEAKPDITATKRINIDYAGEAADYLWRYVLTGSEYLSK